MPFKKILLSESLLKNQKTNRTEKQKQTKNNEFAKF